jgi:hypothetical protein
LTRDLLGEVDPTRLDVTEPHPLYGTTLQEVAAETLLAPARLTGWRYLVAASGEVVTAVDLTTTGEQLSYIWRGPVVDGTVEAIRYTEQVAEDGGEFELRALELRGIHFLALWLSGPRQWLVPVLTGSLELAPAHQPELAPQQLYQESDVAPVLALAARSALELQPEPFS